MATNFWDRLKKRVPNFVRKNIRTFRLVFTDVTVIELLAKEETNKRFREPESRRMKLISQATFDVDAFERIVRILRKRLWRRDEKHWIKSYKALILLEYLLILGPKSFAEEFKSDKDAIKDLINFHYVDKEGFDWDEKIRRKSEWVLKLLTESSVLEEERTRNRKIHYKLHVQSMGFLPVDIITPNEKAENGEIETQRWVTFD